MFVRVALLVAMSVCAGCGLVLDVSPAAELDAAGEDAGPPVRDGGARDAGRGDGAAPEDAGLAADGAVDAGTRVTLGFEFFDQATGEPIKITGTFTFQDIDTTAESVTAQTADVESVGLSSASTNLTATDSGEELAAQSDSTSSANVDQSHWAQFAYSEQQELVFVVTSRGAGTNYAFTTTGFTDAPTVISATPSSVVSTVAATML